MAIKIRKLFNIIDEKAGTKEVVYPITTTKAVKDTTTKKSLFDLLHLTPMLDEVETEVSENLKVDADTLGGNLPSAFVRSEELNGVIAVILSDNWVSQEDGTYMYSLEHVSITGEDVLDVDFYDDGTATEEQVNAFDELVEDIMLDDGVMYLYATIKPSVSFSVLIRGRVNIDVATVGLIELLNKYDTLKAEVNKKLSGFGEAIDISLPYTAETDGYLLVSWGVNDTSSYSSMTFSNSILGDTKLFVPATMFDIKNQSFPVPKGSVTDNTYSLNCNGISYKFLPLK